MNINDLNALQLTGLLQMQGAVGGAGQTRPGLQDGVGLLGQMQQQQLAAQEAQRQQEAARQQGLLFQQGQDDRATEKATTAAALNPDSAASISAREAYAMADPSLLKMPGFEKMSAAQLDKQYKHITAAAKAAAAAKLAADNQAWRQKQHEDDKAYKREMMGFKSRAEKRELSSAFKSRAAEIAAGNPTMTKAQAEAQAATELGYTASDVAVPSSVAVESTTPAAMEAEAAANQPPKLYQNFYRGGTLTGQGEQVRNKFADIDYQAETTKVYKGNQELLDNVNIVRQLMAEGTQSGAVMGSDIVMWIRRALGEEKADLLNSTLAKIQMEGKIKLIERLGSAKAMDSEKESQTALSSLAASTQDPATMKRSLDTIEDAVNESMANIKAQKAFTEHNGLVWGFELPEQTIPVVKDKAERAAELERMIAEEEAKLKMRGRARGGLM